MTTLRLFHPAPWRVRAALAVGLGVLLGLPAAAALAQAQAQAPPQTCRVEGLRHQVLCGQVSRPLDPAQPKGHRIDVHYVVVPATSAAKHPDPLFFFAGGPGQSAIALAGQVLPLFQRLNHRRDIVFIDQRGTGRSAPLTCPPDTALPLAERLDPARAVGRLQACRATLQALPHGDLRHYATPTAMADADAVREALGAARINLVGASYGSRAALDYLRQFPERVRRVVLDGVAPPDMVLPASLADDTAAALEALFTACTADRACRERHPRLREEWQALLAALPRPMSAVDPVSGQASTVTLHAETVAAAVRGPLYAPALAAALPFAVGEAKADRAGPLIGLAGSLSGRSPAMAVAEGMHFSVVCSEDMPRLGAASPPAPAARVFAEAFARPYREVCADWPRAEVPTAFYSLPPSPAPVLAFSGSLDPVTPPRHGERAVRALGAVSAGGQARHVTVSNAGHGVLGIDCTREVVHRFLDAERDDEALAVDASCLAELPRPPAFVPPRPEPAP